MHVCNGSTTSANRCTAKSCEYPGPAKNITYSPTLSLFGKLIKPFGLANGAAVLLSRFLSQLLWEHPLIFHFLVSKKNTTLKWTPNGGFNPHIRILLLQKVVEKVKATTNGLKPPAFSSLLVVSSPLKNHVVKLATKNVMDLQHVISKPTNHSFSPYLLSKGIFKDLQTHHIFLGFTKNIWIFNQLFILIPIKTRP